MIPPTADLVPAAAASREPFSVGAVLSRTLAVWTANLPIFVGATAVLMLPILLIPTGRAGSPGAVGWQGLTSVYASLVGLVISGAFIYGVVQQLRGKSVTPKDLLQAGTRSAGPLLGTGLVTGLLIMCGMILLIIPGILLALRWMLVSPVVVIEPNENPRARSSALTEGHRLALFGMLILITIVAMVLGGLVGAIFGAESVLARFLLYVVVNSVTTSFSAVLYGCAYYALRVEKEGVDVEQLAAVFE